MTKAARSSPLKTKTQSPQISSASLGPNTDIANDQSSSTVCATDVKGSSSGQRDWKWRIQNNETLRFISLCFTSLGCIYGDLGTSPLYVFNSCVDSVGGDTSKEVVYGIASMIIWVFGLIVIVKYCFIVLNIGPNNGEGGQIALYSKIVRILSNGPRGVLVPGDQKLENSLKLSRTDTSYTLIKSFNYHDKLLQKKFVKKILSRLLMISCFLGCSLVMSDGLLTPTTSVLSAVSGIAVAVPSFDNSNNILAVSCAILLVLFFFQKFGAGKISVFFAPVIFVWCVCISVIGVINITHHPDILRAFNPQYAFDLLKKEHNVWVLSSVMLAITGTEAMFSDVGQTGKKPIQFSLVFIIWPSLMLCYLGQAAFIINNPELYKTVFFSSIPGGTSTGFYWFVFVIATMSTTIASQALILSVFSIIKQLICLDCFPKFSVVQVSPSYSGQVYIPAVNWILMVGVICTTVGFNNSDAVTAAYGLGISLDIAVTTILITLNMIYVMDLPIYIPLAFFVIYIPLECSLIIANLRKFVHGAWFPFMICVLVTSFIGFWRWCRSLEISQEYESKINITDLLKPASSPGENKDIDENLNLGESTIVSSAVRLNSEDVESTSRSTSKLKSDPELIITTSSGSQQRLVRYPGVAMIHSNITQHLKPNTVPNVFKSLIKTFPSLPQIVIFISSKVTTEPYVTSDNKFALTKMKGAPGLYNCIYFYGFMDRFEITSSTMHDILLQTSELSKVPRMSLKEILSTNPTSILKKEQTNTISSSVNLSIECNDEKSMSVIHIFENNIVYSKKVLQSPKRLDKSSKTIFIRNIINIVRRFLIESVYSTIKSLCKGGEMMVNFDVPKISNEDDRDKDFVSCHEVLFVGNKVEI